MRLSTLAAIVNRMRCNDVYLVGEATLFQLHEHLLQLGHRVAVEQGVSMRLLVGLLALAEVLDVADARELVGLTRAADGRDEARRLAVGARPLVVGQDLEVEAARLRDGAALHEHLAIAALGLVDQRQLIEHRQRALHVDGQLARRHLAHKLVVREHGVPLDELVALHSRPADRHPIGLTKRDFNLKIHLF
jgi:hypothetical protein